MILQHVWFGKNRWSQSTRMYVPSVRNTPLPWGTRFRCVRCTCQLRVTQPKFKRYHEAKDTIRFNSNLLPPAYGRDERVFKSSRSQPLKGSLGSGGVSISKGIEGEERREKLRTAGRSGACYGCRICVMTPDRMVMSHVLFWARR